MKSKVLINKHYSRISLQSLASKSIWLHKLEGKQAKVLSFLSCVSFLSIFVIVFDMVVIFRHFIIQNKIQKLEMRHVEKFYVHFEWEGVVCDTTPVFPKQFI